ncbi:MAG: roadblock/LC7 domain-containing protein [candidate division Zixibacteria bacterium]|nr:roadblock/LC7 domain-containing protein [candidate division Zixibacteria bacterium]
MSRNGLIIHKQELEQIEKAMVHLLKTAEAKCALLVDKDGHLITRQGFTHSLDTTALAALLAGSFASTREIARLVGEPEFSVLFHQGKKDHIHISLVGERGILAVIFDDRTTIGMVRLYAREIGEELANILSKAQDEGRVEEEEIDSEFTSSAENKLDDIFKD